MAGQYVTTRSKHLLCIHIIVSLASVVVGLDSLAELVGQLHLSNSCKGLMEDSSPLHIVGSRQNILSNTIVVNQQTEPAVEGLESSPDPLSSLLQRLQLQDSTRSPVPTPSHASESRGSDNQRNLRELLETMQRLMSTIPKGLLPGRLRKSMSPKLIVLDLNGLLLDRIKACPPHSLRTLRITARLFSPQSNSPR
jgi:hypothetical protein